MDQALHSKGLRPFESTITNKALQETLEQLTIINDGQKLQLFSWGDGRLAVPIVVPVDLPPLGNVDDVDIRPQEPIILIFNTDNYPSYAPIVFTDRLEFPKTILPHMYLPHGGNPPAFCLVKGGIYAVNEWYANKRINDVLIRVRNWLRDAAAGMLIIDGDHYDPLRLIQYRGSVTYDYSALAEVVRKNNSLVPAENFARLQFELSETKTSYNLTLTKIVTAENLTNTEEEELTEILKEDTSSTKKLLFRGFLLWSISNNPIDLYDVELPKTWGDFKDDFCGKHLLDTEALERELVRNANHAYVKHPIIVAIKRSKTVLGFSDAIEFLNFELSLYTKDIENNSISPSAEISINNHIQPLTHVKAKEISGFHAKDGLGTLVAGAGALGSKIVLHLIKSGNKPIYISDPERLSPHNLIRHGLGARYIHVNKAQALQWEAARLFPNAEQFVFGIDKDATALLKEDVKEDVSRVFDRLYDFTASKTFLHQLNIAKLPSNIRVSKGYLSDFGMLGVLLMEGPERNPRIDDIQAQLYYKAMIDDSLMEWLNREANQSSKSTQITVGIGCSSDTIVLSDDIISMHASLMSGQLKSATNDELTETGIAFLNQVSYEPFFCNFPALHRFPPVTIVSAVNDPDWQVRFSAGIIDELNKMMCIAFPKETGGVLVGSANYKTKTVHVTGLIDTPPDSKANSVCFYRGKDGLAQIVEHVTNRTGGQLGYIGEWHSHPHGPDGMSTKDFDTVSKFKIAYQNEITPLPVFLLIITSNAVLPFIF